LQNSVLRKKKITYANVINALSATAKTVMGTTTAGQALPGHVPI